VRQSGLSWGVVEEAIVDLLKDKPYMKASAPRPSVENNDDTSNDSGQEDTGQQAQQPPTPDQPEQLHPNTIVLPPVETRPIEEELRDGAKRSSTRERTGPASFIEESYSEGESVWEENGELVRGVNVLEQLNAHMETDDNDNEARIASQYRMLTMHDPEFLTVPEADDENISTRDALKAPDAEQFKEAICKEVTDLIDTTKTLRALTPEEVRLSQGIGRLAPHSSVCARRRATAYQTSTRPEAQHVEIN
jgi:hypothetical protein